MKKSIVASAVVAVALGLAACTEEAKAADLTVYGSIEQGITKSGSVMDSTSGDNYIGFKATENFDESGKSGAFAKIEMAYDGETNGLTNREAYVGLNFDKITVQTGRMKNLEKSMVAGNVDIFEGESFSTTGAARVANATAAIVDLGAAKVGVSVITDGANGMETIDAREIAVSSEIAGVNLGAVMVDDKVADTTAKRVSASVNALGATVGGAYDIDAETSTVVGSFTAGSNTFRAGADLDADQNVGKKVFELDHAFSKSTNAYINVSKDGNNTDYTVAMRMVF